MSEIAAQSSFQGKGTTGSLYLVPTPIGNLSDMTFRAIDILKEVDYIAAEDTRNTQKLLNHFDIETSQLSFHEHNTQERIPQFIEKILAGQSIAQVSDAGMPSISDPGHDLVKACIEAKIPVVPLPGANAGITALIASGLAPQPFLFYGFLSRKPKDQKEELAELKNQTMTIIFYEAPHRLKKTLAQLAVSFGGQRKVVLCRELTKRYEEFLRGTLDDAIEWAGSDQVRGEFCVIVEGNDSPEATEVDHLAGMTIEEQVGYLIETGMKTNDAIKEIAKKQEMKKQEIYNLYHHI
ncbi:16S rRNA (cytidine(1402)-2'-O)-methyltransferase [Dellaglioa algida]|uniref:Ribosomal RNA small subunit methyltransferase I n=1 Tax=Dellaglioa algida DSM 15638 TaxID=1423719 RepID=A0A0R1HGU5_9LACO|nr:16S rRNA (cytidine(1402)-2'-O)-methyltransferase [Dellaglioa algida]KRK45742.1 tetrapyrrole methylase [Dellaglioa algida DSM 15638]MDK1733179.1 16S rRNA (cytidine(1402)-2'-O)-methyltransferase [Dellaglioa algida]MDK1734734.1 16S rRNA (cytidine(1402)-2'-O)-methyltransferase [Dellaglioa algida]